MGIKSSLPRAFREGHNPLLKTATQWDMGISEAPGEKVNDGNMKFAIFILFQCPEANC